MGHHEGSRYAHTGTTYMGIVGILSTVVKHWQWQRGWREQNDKDLVISRYLFLNPGHDAVTVNCIVSWLAMVMV